MSYALLFLVFGFVACYFEQKFRAEESHPREWLVWVKAWGASLILAALYVGFSYTEKQSELRQIEQRVNDEVRRAAAGLGGELRPPLVRIDAPDEIFVQYSRPPDPARELLIKEAVAELLRQDGAADIEVDTIRLTSTGKRERWDGLNWIEVK